MLHFHCNVLEYLIITMQLGLPTQLTGLHETTMKFYMGKPRICRDHKQNTMHIILRTYTLFTNHDSFSSD